MQIFLQNGNDLGERLANAFFELGKRCTNKNPILLAGTDSPNYIPEISHRAAEKLTEYDIVLGPSQDGGYYLVGLSYPFYTNQKFLNTVFTHLTWSHNHVFDNQKKRFEEQKCKIWICPEILEDIDTFKDLCSYEKNRKNANKSSSYYSLSLKKFLPTIYVILPVLNEKQNLPPIIRALQKNNYFQKIICADNGSTDGSIEVAKEMGAHVTHCEKRGYGATCLEALSYVRKKGGCEAVLFLDADGSDHLSYLEEILGYVISNQFDFALGARTPSLSSPGALLPHARFGNWLATRLIQLFWGFRYNDLGPFRAISWHSLEMLRMDDKNFGWTIQMQIRALKKSLRIKEIPVAYQKRRAGESKISASIIGSIKAGLIIFRVLFYELFTSQK